MSPGGWAPSLARLCHVFRATREIFRTHAFDSQPSTWYCTSCKRYSTPSVLSRTISIKNWETIVLNIFVGIALSSAATNSVMSQVKLSIFSTKAPFDAIRTSWRFPFFRSTNLLSHLLWRARVSINPFLWMMSVIGTLRNSNSSWSLFADINQFPTFRPAPASTAMSPTDKPHLEFQWARLPL